MAARLIYVTLKFSRRNDRRKSPKRRGCCAASQPTVSRELWRVLRKCWDWRCLSARAGAYIRHSAKGLRLFEEVQRSGMGWIARRQRGGKSARVPSGRTLYRLPRSFHNPFCHRYYRLFWRVIRDVSLNVIARRSRRCWKSGSPLSATT